MSWEGYEWQVARDNWWSVHRLTISVHTASQNIVILPVQTTTSPLISSASLFSVQTACT